MQPDLNLRFAGFGPAPFSDGEKLERPARFWHFPHYQGEGSYPASAVREGDLKLILNHHHDDVLLYDVVTDPSETRNLAEEMPGKAAALKRSLRDYLGETGAYLPRPRS